MRIFMTLIGFLILTSGCAGAGKQHIVRSVPIDPNIPNDPHPLSRPLLGPTGLLRALKCLPSSRDNRKEDDTSVDCSPLVPDPYFSLSLSGGGYRATLFHYGAIKRLNDGGQLRNLRLVCAVSGGSITGAALVSHWDELLFDENNIATNLDIVVGKHLLQLTDKTIDAPVVISNLLTFGTIGRTIVPALNRNHLFHGINLSDLPNSPSSPLLILEAVDIKSGKLFYMSRDFAGYSFNTLINHQMSLSQAIAASSAFPPVLGPIIYKVDPRKTAKGQLHPAEYQLVDGGVMDNLGIPHCGIGSKHLISNAGNPVSETYTEKDWISSTFRSVEIIHSFATERMFSTRCAQDKNLCWSLSDFPKFGTYDREALQAQVDRAKIATRYKSLKKDTQCDLMNAGYITAHSRLAESGKILEHPSLPCPLQIAGQ